MKQVILTRFWLILLVTSILGGSGCSPSKTSSPSPSIHPAPVPSLGLPTHASKSLPAAGFYNNADGFPIFGLIEGALTNIDIEIYEMSDVDVLSALEDAMDRKVKIRIVKEPKPLGFTCDVFAPVKDSDNTNCRKQKNLRSRVLKEGGQYVAFNKTSFCANPKQACFEHGKMMIIDHQAVMISSGNFNSTNLCNLKAKPSKCNRDYSVVETNAKVVNFLSTVFNSDLSEQPYDVLALIQANKLENRVTVSPHSLPPLLKLIRSAQSSIQIQNQYLKEPTINEALIDASKRGVRVEMTIASVCSFGSPSDSAADNLTRQFKAFEEAGISLRLLPAQFKINGKSGYLHSKALVIDQKTAWVGSVNGSTTSTSNNREFGLIFKNAKWVEGLLSVLVADHGSKSMSTWQESLNCEKD